VCGGRGVQGYFYMPREGEGMNVHKVPAMKDGVL
jgi:hypothetical protein